MYAKTSPENTSSSGENRRTSLHRAFKRALQTACKGVSQDFTLSSYPTSARRGIRTASGCWGRCSSVERPTRLLRCSEGSRWRTKQPGERISKKEIVPTPEFLDKKHVTFDQGLDFFLPGKSRRTPGKTAEKLWINKRKQWTSGSNL